MTLARIVRAHGIQPSEARKLTGLEVEALNAVLREEAAQTRRRAR